MLVATAYFAAARLGQRPALVKGVTPLWPPTGIALVAFLEAVFEVGTY